MVKQEPLHKLLLLLRHEVWEDFSITFNKSAGFAVVFAHKGELHESHRS